MREGSATGLVLYKEMHTVTTNQFGLINLEIGNGIPQAGAFPAIAWETGTKWMEIEADFGSGYVSMGSSQLLSVPFALNFVPGPAGNDGVDGADGMPGTNGTNGIDGVDGMPGTNGTNGIDGVDGMPGTNGTNGMDGIDGLNGLPGTNGTNGIDGVDGTPGTNGTNGMDGVDGLPGTNGMDGATGASGINGMDGADGLNGLPGTNGTNGVEGLPGTNGMDGATGASGINGMDGADGLNGLQGTNGTNGIDGVDGVDGSTGATGATGSISQFAMFYGLTSGIGNGGSTDYAATIAVKTGPGTGRIPFPKDGPAAGITRINTTSFTLPTTGTYEIVFSIHTTEPGQIQLELNDVDLPETVVANMNATAGGHLMSGSFFVTTTAPNSVLAVINPSGNATTLTITPANGASTHANSQVLTIKKIF